MGRGGWMCRLWAGRKGKGRDRFEHDYVSLFPWTKLQSLILTVYRLAKLTCERKNQKSGFKRNFPSFCWQRKEKQKVPRICDQERSPWRRFHPSQLQRNIQSRVASHPIPILFHLIPPQHIKPPPLLYKNPTHLPTRLRNPMDTRTSSAAQLSLEDKDGTRAAKSA